MSLKLSIQDLAPIASGTSTPDAFEQTRELARLGDALGFERIWYAEHHGMRAIASASPEVLIASSAAVTSGIRVGAGGVMLPNHVPLRVVETYRTLAGLYPGRIDLGIGRAGGSDGLTLQALRSLNGEHFSEQMSELFAFEYGHFSPEHPFSRLEVVPGGIGLPPVYLLGSSGASAQMAGRTGLGYAFAAHFSPRPAAPAFDAYRATFTPSPDFPEPRTILCLSVLCAPDAEEARFLAGTQALSWARFHTGQPRELLPPETAAGYDYSAEERAVIERQRPLWIVGDPQEVKAEIKMRAEAAGADEVMVATTMHSYALRRRSYRLIAEAFGLSPRGPAGP